MKKISKCLCSLLTVVLLVVSTSAPSLADVSSEKDKLSDLNKQKNDAVQEQKELKASKAEAEEYIKEVDAQLTQLATKIYATQQDLEATEKKIKKTQVKLTAAQADIKNQYADMQLRIQYMYENGDAQMLDLILNSDSFSDFLNKAEYITELSQYDRKMLNEMKNTKQEIASAKKTLEDSKSSLVSMQNKQKQDKAKLENLVATKQEELKGYDTLLADSQEAEAEIENAIKAQERRIATAEQESIRAAEQVTQPPQQVNPPSDNNNNIPTNPPVYTGAGYAWPCPGYTYVSSDYGYRQDPFSGATAFHSGIDIPAPSGVPVVAAESGVVEWSEPNPTAGNWIGINHGNGVSTVYMHMSALLVSAGTRVSKGQTIGLIGTTGSSTGNHLHFSVRQNGAYVNPWNYIGR